MFAKFQGLNPKGRYLNLQKRKENVCVVSTYSIKRAREIRRFQVAVVQPTAKKCTKKVSDAGANLLFN